MPREDLGLRALVLALVLLGGCSFANRPLNRDAVALEDRVRNGTRSALAPMDGPHAASRPADRDTDGCFVGIAISGGGSRSANFSAACLFQLQRLGILHHVDYISSVSGGSLTAAYYCLSDAEWNPAEAQRRLTHPFANDLIFRTFLPWNSLALMFSDWDRSDILAGIFQRVLYTRNGKAATFADLRPDRPRLLLNATDLQTGRRFVFCNENFDELNSDLATYPIASAVAASAAFPAAMHEVTLRDFSTIFKQYKHLIDGGVTDNLGITSLVEAYQSQVKAAAQQKLPHPYPRGAVFIILDADKQFGARISDKSDSGFIASLLMATKLASSSLLTRASSATMSDVVLRNSPDEATAAELRQHIAELEKSGFVAMKDKDDHPVQVVHLAVSRVGTVRRLPSQGFFQSVNNIATYFNISHDDAANLFKAAELLVAEKFEDRLRQIARELDGQ